MLKQKKKKNAIVLVISSLVILTLLVIIGGFFWKSRTKSQVSSSNTSNNPPLKNPDNNSKDKDLAEKIKTDLKERIEQVKNSKKLPDKKYWCPYGVYENEISCEVPGGTGFLKKRESIFPNQFSTEDWTEIVSLINQAKQAHDQWIVQKNQEADQKLANQPDLFYNNYGVSFSGEAGSFSNWGFTGRQKGQKYELIIPKNHPIFTNFSIPGDHLHEYYRITGTESIPLVPSPIDGTGLFKIVKPENQITIKLIEN